MPEDGVQNSVCSRGHACRISCTCLWFPGCWRGFFGFLHHFPFRYALVRVVFDLIFLVTWCSSFRHWWTVLSIRSDPWEHCASTPLRLRSHKPLSPHPVTPIDTISSVSGRHYPIQRLGSNFSAPRWKNEDPTQIEEGPTTCKTLGSRPSKGSDKEHSYHRS